MKSNESLLFSNSMIYKIKKVLYNIPLEGEKYMEKKTRIFNLDGIMYDKEGNFIPRTSEYGNVDEDLAHLRNIFMKNEKDYFEELLGSNKTFGEFEVLTKMDASYLFDLATKLQDKIEMGELETLEEKKKMSSTTPEAFDEFHMDKLIKAESLMTLLFAAAADKGKIKVKRFVYQTSKTK